MSYTIGQRVADFMRVNGMDAGSVDIAGSCKAFLREMEAGLSGAPSSLRMIPTYVGAGKAIPTDEPVIAIDAGGTNFRVCIVRFDANRTPVIEDFKLYPMPGTRGRLTRGEFFGAMADYLAPVVDKARKIGFCFSYPTEILPGGDGRLIRFSKEVQAEGVEGQLMGRGLLDAVAASGHRADKSIILLNDTVATLLGGQAVRASHPYGSYIGFILGTGTNTCYIERNAAITKIPSLDAAGSMLINIESGGFAKAPRGTVDRAMDERTVNPGEQQFEKMISGGYFGDMALTTLKAASSAGLFSDGCARRIEALGGFATKDANEFVEAPYGDNTVSRCCGDGEDRTAAYYLLDGLFERAAKLVAVNLSAVILKSGGGSDPCMPVLVTADGTMFHKSKSFRRKLDYYIKEYLEGTLGLYCEFIEVENATLLGTAIAGLTGCV